MAVRTKSPRTPPRLLTLVLATATGAVAMNIFLPSIPGMARHFNVEYALMQLTVTVYLFAMAAIQLMVGPLSDRFGRRPVLLSCFSVFMLATVAVIMAPTFEFLLAMRILQAFSAAGMVLSRAIVRDMVAPARAASMFGYITMGMALAPMSAPVIGGLLDEMYGWQATFGMLLVVGAIAFIFIFIDLGETNMHRSASFMAQYRAYPELLKSRRFWGYVLTGGFTSGQFFAFVGGGPYVGSVILGLSPSHYGLLFGMMSAGYVLGNFLSGRYAERIGIRRMMVTGNIVSLAGLLTALFLLVAVTDHPLAFFALVSFTGLGNGIALPSINAGIVSVRPHLAGSASGLGAAMQIGLGALFSVLGGAFLAPDTGPFPLLGVMIFATFASIACGLYVISVERSLRKAVE
jgi:DHA1 family bicyclomycin/chloramphenicol resistance-like MFS transporter